ncbi:gpi-anchored cell wall organization protein ecm33 [Phlyctema vagabunda]|uniref:Gpi-anchored cell wall organization protein ecm33 n=1 Tax=Phlyctema vagabunda TaxID=108571 RepID=A0ABR4PT92_9HELO
MGMRALGIILLGLTCFGNADLDVPEGTNSSCIANPGQAELGFTGFNVNSQEEADLLSGCELVVGDVRITNDSLETITFNGVAQIYGGLNFSSSHSLLTFSAPDLTQISSGFVLYDLPLFEEWNLPILNYIGFIDWQRLPSVRELNVTPASPLIPSVTITETSATVINLGTANVNDLTITHNSMLQHLVLTGLEDTGVLDIAGNGNSITRNVYLDALKSAESIRIMNATSLEMPLLEQVTRGELVIAYNTFTTLPTPHLYSVGESLRIIENPYLSKINMPSLELIGTSNGNGTLEIEGNGKLTIEEMSSLRWVRGDIYVEGDVDSLSFPSMTRYNSGVFINSTNTGFNCTAMDVIHKETAEDIKFSYTCRASAPDKKKDVAVHLKKKTTVSNRVMWAIVIGCIAVVAFSSALTWRIWWRRIPLAPIVPPENPNYEEHDLPPIYRPTAPDVDYLPRYKENPSINETRIEGGIAEERVQPPESRSDDIIEPLDIQPIRT